MIGWPSWSASTAPRWCSSTRGGWSRAWPRAFIGAARRRECRRASRQSLQGAAPRCGAAAEARRTEGAGGDRIPGTRHRHRRCGSGVPDGLAALHQCVPAARGPRRATRWAGPPKGRLFPLSRDDLVECSGAARCRAARRTGSPGDSAELRSTCLRSRSTAEVAAREWDEDELFALLRARLSLPDAARAKEFDELVHMLAEGFSTRRGRTGALCSITTPSIKCSVPRKGARLTALTSGGAIPDNADYKVMLEPEGHLVGTVNEDFAVESLQGDVFQLGNTSYRILRVERGTVRVEDAHGQPPSIPFWLGEAPGRTDELSAAVSRSAQEIERRLDSARPADGQWRCHAMADGGGRPRRRSRRCSWSIPQPPAAPRSARCRR